jgi:hypothetical protein
MLNQTIPSVAQVKINFMKNEDKILAAGSKASNRQMRDGSFSLVGELIDGLNLQMLFSDGSADMTQELKGATVNLRIRPEAFETLNARFHELGNIGATVQVTVDGNVEYGTLVSNGREVESYTIYVTSVDQVEEIAIQRVGSRSDKAGVLSRMQAHKQENAANRDAAIAMRRPQVQAAKAGAAENAVVFS